MEGLVLFAQFAVEGGHADAQLLGGPLALGGVAHLPHLLQDHLAFVLAGQLGQVLAGSSALGCSLERMISSPTRSPFSKITAYSTRLRSSRMLPGKGDSAAAGFHTRW